MCLALLSSDTTAFNSVFNTPILCQENTMSCMFIYRKMKLASKCIGYEENAKAMEAYSVCRKKMRILNPVVGNRAFTCHWMLLQTEEPARFGAPERARDEGSREAGWEGSEFGACHKERHDSVSLSIRTEDP